MATICNLCFSLQSNDVGKIHQDPGNLIYITSSFMLYFTSQAYKMGEWVGRH